MNATGIPLKEPAVSAAAGDTEQLERAYIDASTRVPVLMFYASAIAWLILGTLLAGFVSWKLHSPDLLSDISFLTWGRVRPVHMNVMVYGWASMAGMGTAIWLMARLCRTVLRYPLRVRNSSRRQHWLSMARVPQLRCHHSFRRLHACCLLGRADVSVSARG